MELDQASARVLGALMEKEMTTPDLYPLSLNALGNACNQRSSREPVMDLDEGGVRAGLDTLEAHGLVAPARDGGRVTRWEHRIRTVLSLRRDETALLCLLLLRGPQTPGELRSRADRMFPFDDLPAVQAALERMAARAEPLAAFMPRAAGAREARWMHLLGGPAAPAHAAAAHPQAPEGQAAAAAALDELTLRLQSLEARVRTVETRLAEALGDKPESE